MGNVSFIIKHSKEKAELLRVEACFFSLWSNRHLFKSGNYIRYTPKTTTGKTSSELHGFWFRFLTELFPYAKFDASKKTCEVSFEDPDNYLRVLAPLVATRYLDINEPAVEQIIQFVYTHKDSFDVFDLFQVGHYFFKSFNSNHTFLPPLQKCLYAGHENPRLLISPKEFITKALETKYTSGTSGLSKLMFSDNDKLTASERSTLYDEVAKLVGLNGDKKKNIDQAISLLKK